MWRKYEVVCLAIIDVLVCAAIVIWAVRAVHPYVTHTSNIHNQDEQQVQTNEEPKETPGEIDEHRHEDYESRYREVDTSGIHQRRRTQKESDKLYDWVDWEYDKPKRVFAGPDFRGS